MKALSIKTTLATVILAALSTSAFAYDAQINITGELTESTCLINGGSSPAVQNVTLPTLSKSSLTNPGAWSGRVPVNFELSNCSVGTSGATATFENGPNISADGNMKNLATTNAASNVEVQLLDKTATPINLAVDTVSTPITNSAGDLQFYVQYFSKDGNASAGQVSSHVEFSMSYN
ncbi:MULTISPECIES: fimbrial protein [unclassified Serratia (in: enterobacteria)]|uniref:fimbrial protein n=1 Tax=unclassified Serratia (in: enterobacteria) TaxID=2647522 RepID=UPI0030762FE0